jgi:hypothetical protein
MLMFRCLRLWLLSLAAIICIDAVVMGRFEVRGITVALGALMLPFAGLLLRDYAGAPRQPNMLLTVAASVAVVVAYIALAVVDTMHPGLPLFLFSALVVAATGVAAPALAATGGCAGGVAGGPAGGLVGLQDQAQRDHGLAGAARQTLAPGGVDLQAVRNQRVGVAELVARAVALLAVGFGGQRVALVELELGADAPGGIGAARVPGAHHAGVQVQQHAVVRSEKLSGTLADRSPSSRVRAELVGQHQPMPQPPASSGLNTVLACRRP